MSRLPARVERPKASPYCPENDCQREQAQALTRLAATAEAALAEFDNLKPTLQAIGEIAGKWLRFCAFLRKWFPRLWVFIPLLAGMLFKGSSEATDALIQAVTAYLTMQAGGGA